MAEAKCVAQKDFLRHIANRVISENTAKIPLPVINDIRKALGRAEDHFKFSVFGGDPARLVDFLNSQEFQDLIEMLRVHNLVWVIERILQDLMREYSESCPPVAEAAAKVLEDLRRTPKERSDKEKMDLDVIYRTLKLHGYKVERSEEGYLVVDEPGMRVRISVSGGVIEYQICRLGRAQTLEAVLSKIEKIREL
jgi:hypothetical protein